MKVEPPGGRLEYVFFDSKTFLIDRVEEIRGARRLTITFSDYRTTSGRTEPWRVHTSDGFATNDGDKVLQSLQIGGPVSASELNVPAGGPPLISPPASPLQIPVQMSGDVVVVPIKMGGHTVDFILDSGAADIVVDSSVCDALGIKQYGRITSETAGTYVESEVVLPSMAAGTLQLQNVHARSLPFTQWTDAGTPIAGLLGYDFIRDGVWHVNYQNGTLEVISPSAFKPPAAAQALPVTFDDNVPTLGITLNGVAAPAFVLDTGAYRSTLFSRFVRLHQAALADRGSQGNDRRLPFVDIAAWRR